jgi:hypothetical protein
MVQLQLTDDEAGILLNLIDNYMPELAVEIHRTEGQKAAAKAKPAAKRAAAKTAKKKK